VPNFLDGRRAVVAAPTFAHVLPRRISFRFVSFRPPSRAFSRRRVPHKNDDADGALVGRVGVVSLHVNQLDVAMPLTLALALTETLTDADAVAAARRFATKLAP